MCILEICTVSNLLSVKIRQTISNHRYYLQLNFPPDKNKNSSDMKTVLHMAADLFGLIFLWDTLYFPISSHWHHHSDLHSSGHWPFKTSTSIQMEYKSENLTFWHEVKFVFLSKIQAKNAIKIHFPDGIIPHFTSVLLKTQFQLTLPKMRPYNRMTKMLIQFIWAHLLILTVL